MKPSMKKYMRVNGSLPITLLLLALLAGCSNLGIFQPYYITLDQGNIFTQEQVDEIELGMSGRQVRFILGTPTLVDTFNRNRWDYLYTLTERDKMSVKQHLAIIFENDKVVDIQQLVAEAASS